MKYIYILLLAIKEIYLYVAFLLTTGGRDFAECSAKSPLHSAKSGKNFLGKGSLSSAFYRGTRQNKKKLPNVWGGTRQNISAVVAPAVNGYFAECPTQHSAKKKLFFLIYFAKCPSPGTPQSFF